MNAPVLELLALGDNEIHCIAELKYCHSLVLLVLCKNYQNYRKEQNRGNESPYNNGDKKIRLADDRKKG